MTIRVLVVDDSLVVRRSVADILGGEPDIEVVATAPDGYAGLRRIEEHLPDVVTLDVEMPGLDGIGTLREIRRRWPRLPVIMYSTLTARGAATTLDALALGANDYATKPDRPTDRAQATAQVKGALLPIIRLWGDPAARVPPVRVTPTTPVPAAPVPATSVPATPGPATSVPGGPAPAATVPATGTPADGRGTAPRAVAPLRSPRPPRLVVVGVSTGGPDALATLVPALPARLAVPVVVVQHMPPVFTQMLAARLDRTSAITVREAVDGEPALPGHVYIAPGGRHTEVHADAGGPGYLRLALSDGDAENSCRPAADVLFRTASAATAGRLLALVLTGMGQDGREGARGVKRAGGAVLAQDEPTSVVWGMPGFVARDGTADAVLPLPDLAPTLVSLTQPVLSGALA